MGWQVDRKKAGYAVVCLIIFAGFHYYRNSDARACESELRYQIRMAPESKDEMIKSCVETIRFMRDHNLH